MPGFRLCSAAFIVAVSLVTEAHAQFGAPLSRAQSRITEQAISRTLSHVFKPKLVVSRGATGPVTAMTLGRDEHYLITAVGDQSLRIWDLWVGRELVRLPGHPGRVSAIAQDARNETFVTASSDHTLKVWDMGRLAIRQSIATGSADVTGLALDGDGRWVATGTADGFLSVWSLPEGRLVFRTKAHGAAGPVAVAVAPNGREIVSGGAEGTVRRWDAASGAALGSVEVGAPVTSLALSAEGRSLAAGLNNGTAVLIPTGGGAPLRLDGHDGPVTSLRFGGNGADLTTGGADGRLILHGAPGTPRAFQRPLGRHDKAVTGLENSRDGKFVLSVSEDGTTRLWNTATATQLLTLLSTRSGWTVVDAKGRYDGNQEALSGIEWKAEDETANIDDFAETHYEAALLPRTVKDGDAIPDARNIAEGVAYPPKVHIVSSGERGAARTAVVDVSAEDRGGGIAEIRLYRNGKRIQSRETAATRDRGDGRVVHRYEVALGNGETVISATALNREKLESRPESISLGQGPLDGDGNIHLLTVGINRYRDRSLTLFYAKPDADGIDDFFASGKAIMPLKDTQRLRDAQASEANLIASLRKLRDVPQDDLVVIYLAGHGMSDGDQWYFLTHDADLGGASDMPPVGVLSSAEFKNEVEGINANRILLLVDTCQSGAAIDPLRDYRGMKSLHLLARSSGAHILVATDSSQSALEVEKLGHGVFTYALLDGLSGKASLPDGTVSATSLIRYVEREVPVLLRQNGENAEQYPTSFSRGHDFSIVRTGGEFWPLRLMPH